MLHGWSISWHCTRADVGEQTHRFRWKFCVFTRTRRAHRQYQYAFCQILDWNVESVPESVLSVTAIWRCVFIAIPRCYRARNFKAEKIASGEKTLFYARFSVISLHVRLRFHPISIILICLCVINKYCSESPESGQSNITICSTGTCPGCRAFCDCLRNGEMHSTKMAMCCCAVCACECWLANILCVIVQCCPPQITRGICRACWFIVESLPISREPRCECHANTLRPPPASTATICVRPNSNNVSSSLRCHRRTFRLVPKVA